MNYKCTECGPSRFGSSRERIAAANAANAQYAGQQRVLSGRQAASKSPLLTVLSPRSNSVLCVECFRWVYKRCSGIKGKLKSNVDFRRRRGWRRVFLGQYCRVKLECVPKFCYLGATLGAGGGTDETARARVRCDWIKFKELWSILVVRGASYHMIEGRDF